MKYLLIIAAVLVFIVPDKAEAVANRGFTDCGKWLEGRKEDGNLAALGFLSHTFWLTGYLSGLATGTDREFWGPKVGGLSPEQVLYWMDNYCRENPLQTTQDGAKRLFRERTGY